MEVAVALEVAAVTVVHYFVAVAMAAAIEAVVEVVVGAAAAVRVLALTRPIVRASAVWASMAEPASAASMERAMGGALPAPILPMPVAVVAAAKGVSATEAVTAAVCHSWSRSFP